MARDQKGDPLGRVIGQRLAASRIAGDAQCPDASIIAAYREGLLPTNEHVNCERHFAQCARCGSALAALARLDDGVDKVAVGDASTQAGRSDNRAWWRPHGPLPLAALGAVAAILIVVAIRTSTPRGPVGTEARSEFQAKPLTANTAPLTANPAPSIGFVGNGAMVGNNSMAMNEAVRPQPAPPLVHKPLAAMAPSPLSESRSMLREPERARSASRSELMKKKALAANLYNENMQVGAVSAAPAAAPAPAPAVGGVAAIGAGAAMSGGGDLAPSTMATAGLPTMSGGNAIAVETPDHTTATVVWMVGAHGAIARYSPATGWVAQTSGVTTDLTRGSAPSMTTCWVVGRSGTILRTVDGEHWTKIVAPVNDDVTGIVASSAIDATISTASNRRFTTLDGGATWRPL